MRRTCVELFAGGGGAALGLRAAGLHSLACVEGDAAACATLQANGFPARHAWIGTPPDGADLPAWDAVGDGAVGCWLLWASPPCQPYSRAGKQMGHSDGRDGWPATVEAIRTIRPAWFVIENVVGFPAQEKAAELVAAGLCASARVWDLDAVRYGLPSRRRRLFIIGRRDPGPMPRIPLFTHYAPEDEPVLMAMDEAMKLRPREGEVQISQEVVDDIRIGLYAQMRRWVSMGEALPHLAASGHRFACRSTHPEEGGGEPTPCPERREIDMTDRPSRCVAASYSGGKGGESYVVSRRGREGGPRDEARGIDQPSTCIRTAGGGSSIPFLVVGQNASPKAGNKPVTMDSPSTTITTGGTHYATVVPGNGGNLPAPRPLTEPSHTITVGSGQAMYYTPEQTLGQAGSRPEMLDNPSPCVVCSEEKGTRARRATAWTYNGGPDRAADAAFMATGRRRLEPEEVAVLVGFPTTHRFMGNKGQVYRQIGNAVAPIMAQRIAQAILLCDGINNSEKE